MKTLLTALILILLALSPLHGQNNFTVTLTVLDSDNIPLPGMNINIWLVKNPSVILIDQDTDSQGQVACSLPPGSYGFDVYDYYECYEYYEDTFSVISQDIEITVNLTAVEFEVLFEILDSLENPIASASIEIAGSDTLTTGQDGRALTYLTRGLYPYTVSHPCYNSLSSSVNIGGIKDPSYHLLHSLTASVTPVNFTVTWQSSPVMGACINIDGVIDPVITDIAGQASISLFCGDYSYTITAGSYEPHTSSFSLQGTELFIDIELDYTPLPIPAALSLDNPAYAGIWQWEYTRGSLWTILLENTTAKKLLAGDITGDSQPELLMLSQDNSLWYYDFIQESWSQLISPYYQCLDFTLADSSVIASLKDYGLYIWDCSQGNDFPSSWSRLIMYPAIILHSANIDRSPDGSQELIVAFRDYAGMYVYDFNNSRFSRAMTVTPSCITSADITGDGHHELVISFPGFGVYLAGYVPFGKTSPKSLEFLRITTGTPDQDHRIGTGDLILGPGSEIIMTFLGSTYCYSYDSLSWSRLISAPFKQIISGFFTGGPRDDLILCESSSGSIYRYNSALASFEPLLLHGDAKAMAPIK